MRRTGYLILVSGLIGLGSTSCGTFADDCFNGAECSGVFGSGGSSTTSTTTTSTTVSSTSTGVAPGCDPTDKTFVSDACGVFVAVAGTGAGKGTQADPMATLTLAIDAAITSKKNVVFACADNFTEQVKIAGAVAIYGGFDCSTPTWTPKMGGTTTLNGLADSVALTIDTSEHVSLDSVDVIAPAAVAPSASSIAVLVNLAVADFTNCKFTSNDGKDGTKGAAIAPDPKLDGIKGLVGADVCASGSHKGGVEQTNTCASGGVSASGKGGDGGVVTGALPSPAGDGTAGTPSDVTMVGGGGLGEGSPGAVVCAQGQDGAKGAVGADAMGAAALGALTKSGYQGTAGVVGETGRPGQGGGGGGGSKGGKAAVACGVAAADDYIGSSGGSGGTGGCGGLGGAGGLPGGSSIALVSLGATVTLTTVTLTPGKGGNGGDGGPGQNGGAQGPKGSGGMASGVILAGCDGGKGGLGGNGGPGAGGQGGHSLGIAYMGTLPAGKPVLPMKPTPGAGGAAGPNAKDPAVGKGPSGNSTTPTSFVLQFK